MHVTNQSKAGSAWSRGKRRVGRVGPAALAFLWLLPASLIAAESSDRPDFSRLVYRQVGDSSLHAYLFRPPEPSIGEETHAILLLHGGGWNSGQPDWVFPAARRFANQGLVAIAIQYRLSKGDLTPRDALDDTCAALRWTRAKSAELGLSGRVAGYGVSAGGHLLAATATIGCPPDDPTGRTAGPDLLLLWSPALDLVRDQWFISKLQGRATAADLSPARHVGAATPPTSIVQGELDALTPLRGARRYCDRLRELEVPCDLHVYPGLGHLLTRNLANQERDFDPDPEARADGIARHSQFLRDRGFVRSEDRGQDRGEPPVEEAAPVDDADRPHRP